MATNKGRGSNLTQEDRIKGGQNSGGGGGAENNPGNFANDREKAREAGKKGGKR
ncbi:MAG: KGG domain-containing protein [Meiothermus sp.]|nr:KGG domain-containing protein [Meiothermus sp.]